MHDGNNLGGMKHDRAADLAALGLPGDADEKAMRAAYRRLAIANHPDRGGSHAAMSRINEAFDRLTAPEPEPAVAAGPPVWSPKRDGHVTPQPEARWFDAVLPALRTTLSAAAIPILIILPAATVVGFLYVVGKILF